MTDPDDASSPQGESPTDPTPPNAFAALGLGPGLVRGLEALGYEEPTPIQREAIPPLLAGRDLLGRAATGTGKTAAFALPLLQRVLAAERPAAPNAPRALVLVPTRELAMQVAEAVYRYGHGRSEAGRAPERPRAAVLPIYGGQSILQQLRVLDRGVEIVVATPGRAMDHLRRGSLSLADVGTVVLDEADEMLDMGFAEDLEAILERLPKPHQTALFSATLPPRIRAIAKRHLADPVVVEIASERATPGVVPRVRQIAYVVGRAQKPAALARVLDMEGPTSAIVFCRTRVEVDELTEGMNAHGYRAEALHGGFAQEQRDRVMKRFRSSATDLLVATDVAARGLDVEHVTHVVNYDVPTEPDAYVHRIGRTGRAGREGVAITLVEPREQRLLKGIQRATGQTIPFATLPTVADLRARRLELTRAALREAVLAGELDAYRTLVGELASEIDPLEVAAAAVKLAHQASHAEIEARADEQDVVLQPATRPDRGDWRSNEARDRGPRFGGAPPRDRGPRVGAPATRDGGPRGRARDDAPLGGDGPRHARPARRPERARDDRGPRAHGFDSTRLFVGAGRMDGLRPADLVGAIANEAGVPGDAIGAIEINDRFALVEVPEDFVDEIVQALRGTTIRGRRVNVRRDKAQ